jgi:hypothetical protein
MARGRVQKQITAAASKRLQYIHDRTAYIGLTVIGSRQVRSAQGMRIYAFRAAHLFVTVTSCWPMRCAAIAYMRIINKQRIVVFAAVLSRYI